jgi:DNA-directed RNA polymerase specialized sigma24 family protein
VDGTRTTESSITALRSAIREANHSAADALLEKILRDCDVEIDAVAARFCLPPDDSTDLRRRVHARVREAAAGSEAIWEQRFRAAVTRVAMREARELDRTPEKTVRLLRATNRMGQGTPVTMLTDQLLAMTEPGIHAVANRFNFGLEPRAELRQRVHAKVWEKVRGEDTFWERRFGLALKRVALNEARSIIREPDFNTLAEGDLRVLLQTTNELHLRASDVERCLALLPTKLKQAVELHYLEDLPIESADEAAETVSRRMGVTGRSVRNYLRHAKTRLRECLSR